MSLFEAGGTRRLVLEGAYKALLAIPPASVESERAFFAAGYLCSEIRSRMADKTLYTLCFLRSYFQNHA